MPIAPKYTLAGKSMLPKASRQFTDREPFIERFRNLCEEKSEKNFNILVFYGVGGIGKTTLRKEFGKILNSDYPEILWGAVDLDVPTYREQESSLFVLRNILNERYKVHFPSFDLAYTAYWHKTHPQTPMTKDNFPLFSGANVVAGIVRVVGEMPWVGWVPKLTKTFMTGGNVFREWWKKRGERELANLPELEAKDIALRLPMFWASDLKDFLEENKSKAVLFLDTYEALWENISAEGGFFLRDEWVRELVANLPEGIWVFCGREKLRWDEIDPEWNEYFDQHLVGALSDLDALKFLGSCKIEEDKIKNVIVKASKGLPYFLDLAVDTYYEIKSRSNRNPDTTDFAKNQQEVLERFLRYLDRTEIETLKVLSSSRLWNREIFEKLISHFKTGYPATAMLDLCRFSFIFEGNLKNYFTMHELMRDSLQNKQDKENIVLVHKFLFELYDEKLKAVDIKNITDENKLAFNEAFYHGKVSLNPDEYLQWFLKTFVIFQKGAAWRLVINLNSDILNYLENIFGKDDVRLAILHNNLGVLLTEFGLYTEAEVQHKVALNIREKKLEENHPEIATSYNYLAIIYNLEGKYAEAETYFRKALKIREICFPPDDINIAASLNNLASVLVDEGRYDDAEPLHKRALEIREKNLGSEHPDVASSLANLAVFYYEQGNISESINLQKRVLKIIEKIFGIEHPNYARDLTNLGVFYDAFGNYIEAEKLYDRALRIFKKTLVPESPALAMALSNFGHFYYYQGRYIEAEPLQKQALEIFEKALGPGHPDVATALDNLAELYRIQANFDEAEKLFKQSLDIKEKKLGSNHPKVSESLRGLAQVKLDINKLDEAEKLLKKALNIRTKAFGNKHFSIAEYLINVADCFLLQGKYDKAEKFYSKSLRITQESLGETHPQIGDCFIGLAKIKILNKSYKEAEELIIKALKIWEDSFGPEHPQLIEALKGLGKIYFETKRYKDSENIYERILIIAEKSLRKTHPKIEEAKNFLKEIRKAVVSSQ
jgi:tetratricopeptide (TPR) repeat protein